MEKKKSKVTKTLSIIGNILLYTIFILSFVLLSFSIASKNSGGEGVSIGNHQFMTILTNSMEKSEYTDVSQFEIKDLPINTLISIENVPKEEDKANEWYGDIKVGDVLTFKYYYTTQEIITHRVVEIEPNKQNGYTITLEGDNKASESHGLMQQVINTADEGSPNYVIGKVVWECHWLGEVITAFRSKIGLIFIVIVPCGLIIIYEALKIGMHIVNKKKAVLETKNADKDLEIEALKKQLEEAQALSKHNESSSTPNEDADAKED